MTKEKDPNGIAPHEPGAKLDVHPDGTITDCCKGTGFAYQTVKNHIDEIKIMEKYHGEISWRNIMDNITL